MSCKTVKSLGKTCALHTVRLRLKSIVKLVGVDTDETDVGGDKDGVEGGQPDSIDEYLETTLDEDAVNAAAAAAAADVKRRLEFESPSAVTAAAAESDGGKPAKDARCAYKLVFHCSVQNSKFNISNRSNADDLGVSSLADLKIVDAAAPAAAETPKERKDHAAKRSLFCDSDDEEDTASRNSNSKTESINSLESTGKCPTHFCDCFVYRNAVKYVG